VRVCMKYININSYILMRAHTDSAPLLDSQQSDDSSFTAGHTHTDKAKKGASVVGSTINLLNTVVGK
jgi:hypothetical protein